MIKTGIYPAVVKYLSELSATLSSLKNNGIELDESRLLVISEQLNSLTATVDTLKSAIAQHDFDSIEEHLQFCAKTIRPLMDEARVFADALESEVSDELWPFPTYQEMLFIK